MQWLNKSFAEERAERRGERKRPGWPESDKEGVSTRDETPESKVSARSSGVCHKAFKSCRQSENQCQRRGQCCAESCIPAAL